MEGSDDEESWVTVGSSTVAHYYSKLFFTHGQGGTPLGRGSVLVLDAALPWQASFYYLWLGMPLFAMAAVALALASARYSVKWTVLAGLFWQALCSFVFGFAVFKWGEDDSVHALASGLVFGGAWAALAFFEECVDAVVLCAGVSCFAIQASLHRRVTGRVLTLEAGAGLMPWGMLWGALGVAMVWMRVRVILKAVGGVREGRAKYDEVWERVVGEQREDVQELERTVEALLGGTSGKSARQLTRNTTIASAWSRSRSRVQSLLPWGMASRSRLRTNSQVAVSDEQSKRVWGFLAMNVLQSDRLHNTILEYSWRVGLPLEGTGAFKGDTVRVKTLDQLLSQAFLVSDHFVDIVVGLGKKHRGLFLLKSGGQRKVPEFESWHGGPLARGKFQLGGVKSVASCLRKLEFAYGRDVTRLVDVCRETLYFESMADLEACLRTVGRDDRLEIVRVKNTMRLDGDGREVGGGMPFVNVCVRLVGDEQARSLCVDCHCCELLLVLTDVARVQTPEMRRAYLEWRICKRVVDGLGRFGRSVFSCWKPVRKLVSPGAAAAVHPSNDLDFERPASLEAPEPLETEHDVGQGLPTNIGPNLGSESSLPAPNEAEGSVIVSVSDVSEAYSRDTLTISRTGSSMRSQIVSVSDMSTTAASLSNQTSNQTGGSSKRPHGASWDSAASVPSPRGLDPAARGPAPAPSMLRAMSEQDSTKQDSESSVLSSQAASSVVVSYQAVPAPPMHVALEPVAEGYSLADETKVMKWLNGMTSGLDGHQLSFDGGETSWGLSLSSEMEELLEGLCRMSALGISAFLDLRLDSVRNNQDFRFDTSDVGAVMLSTRPLSAALNTRIVQIGFLFVAGFLMLPQATREYSCFAGKPVDKPFFGPWVHYRMETMLTRNGTYGAALRGPGASDFGIIGSSRCSPYGTVRAEVAGKSTVIGNSLLSTYPGGAEMWGWYVQTGEEPGSEPLDPSYFVIWASNDTLKPVNGSCEAEIFDPWKTLTYELKVNWCGATWRNVGAPNWRFRDQPSLVGFVKVPTSLASARGADGLRSYLLHPPWYHHVLYWVLPSALTGVGLIASAVTAGLLLPYRKHIWFPAPYLFAVSGFVQTVILSAVHALITLADGAPNLAFESGTNAVVVTFLCIGGVFQGYSGPIPLIMLLMYGVFDMIRWTGTEAYIMQRNIDRIRHTNFGIVALGFSAMFLTLRLVGLARAWFLQQQDKEKYFAVWSKLQDSPVESVALKELGALVEKIYRDLGLDDSCRQVNRLRKDADDLHADVFETQDEEAPGAGTQEDTIHPLLSDLGLELVPGAKDSMSPVTSFNQLYCQGAIATQLLLERLKDWANVSNGMFPEGTVGGSDTSITPWSDIKGDDDRVSRCMSYVGRMKKHARCIEKLLRVYNNDVSRLLDIARCCIIFESVQELRVCLQAMADDREVAIERVKNRLSLDYDANSTDGYRSVVVNVRMVGPQAQALGWYMRARNSRGT